MTSLKFTLTELMASVLFRHLLFLQLKGKNFHMNKEKICFERFLAVAERGEKPSIYIYDTTKLGATRKGIKKNLTFTDTNFKDITAISYVPSMEDKFLVFLVTNFCYSKNF